MKRSLHLLLYSLFFLFVSCSGSYHVKESQASQTRIRPDSLQLVDSAIVNMIAPYKQKLDAQMNEVIAVTENDLVKEQPEGTLCTLLAEASMAYANKISDRPVDLCVMNYGGVRIPFIAKGNITLRNVYEFMPFDNQLELVEIDAATCKEVLDLVARSGGGPISGARITIANKTAQDILIQNKPWDSTRTYLLLSSDYLINGGDGATMFQHPIKRISLNYKVRDALIDYLRDQTANKTTINIQKDGRITRIQP
jgi:2',3'-cyclic-nucleotide 2'-phosphodiesterase (5'-nucleotidase family)